MQRGLKVAGLPASALRPVARLNAKRIERLGCLGDKQK